MCDLENLSISMITIAFDELMEYLSIVKDIPKRDISTSDPLFKLCEKEFKEAVIEVIPCIKVVENADNEFWKIKDIDLLRKKLILDGKNKMCISECYNGFLSEKLNQAIGWDTKIYVNKNNFVGNIKEMEAIVYALFYGFDLTVILATIKNYIEPEDESTLNNAGDRLRLTLCYQTWFNNITRRIELHKLIHSPHTFKFSADAFLEKSGDIILKELNIYPGFNNVLEMNPDKGKEDTES